MGNRWAKFLAGACVAAALVTAAAPASSLPTRIHGRLTYLSTTGDFIGGGQHKHFVTGTRRDVVTTMQVRTLYPNDNSIQVNVVQGNHAHWVDVFLAAPDGAPLQRGYYPNAQREPFKDAGHPGLWVATDGRGCNHAYGEFLVHYIKRAADGHITRLSVSFRQHCEDPSAPLLRGSLRYAEIGLP